MKKLIAVALTLAVLLSLAACGSGGKTSPAQSEETTDVQYGKYVCYKITIQDEDCPVDGEWIQLDPDGKGRLGISLEVDMEWELDGEDLTIDALGGPYEGTLKDGKIELDWGGTMMYFALSDETDELPTEPSQQIPYTEPTELNYADAYVTDAAAKTLTVDDLKMEFRVPKIVFDGEGIDNLNEMIYYQLYDGVYQEYVEKSMEDYGMPGICSMNYFWGVSGEYLSIVVSYAYYASSGSSFAIYNVDLSAGELASEAEVLTHYGYSADDFRERAKDVMGSALLDQYASLLDEPDMKIELDDLVRRTTSDEYVNDAFPFVGEDGKLWMVAPIASIAGADRYSQVIPFADYPISDTYLGYGFG